MDQTGFHNWHHTQSPKVLFIDSQDASHRSPEGHSEFSFVFNDAIHILTGIQVDLGQTIGVADSEDEDLMP